MVVTCPLLISGSSCHLHLFTGDKRVNANVSLCRTAALREAGQQRRGGEERGVSSVRKQRTALLERKKANTCRRSAPATVERTYTETYSGTASTATRPRVKESGENRKKEETLR